MADLKISQLTELTSSLIASGDWIPIVDVSDTSMAATGTTKKVGASDVAIATKANTFTAAQTVNATLTASNFAGGSTGSIADDNVVTFVPSPFSGVILVHCTNSSNTFALMQYRRGAYLSTIAVGSNANITTGVLTGTTGTDGKVNISLSGSNIYIENRLGASRTFGYIILAGA